MQDGEGRPLEPVYLLNQFDASSALHREVREVLRGELGERLLPFSIRRSSGVGEALAEGTTVVDCDPESEVAKDYFGVAEWLLTASMPGLPTIPGRRSEWRSGPDCLQADLGRHRAARGMEGQ